MPYHKAVSDGEKYYCIKLTIIISIIFLGDGHWTPPPEDTQYHPHPPHSREENILYFRSQTKQHYNKAHLNNTFLDNNDIEFNHINSIDSVRLYDMKIDKYEIKNLASLYPEVVKSLLDRLQAYNQTAVPCRYPHYDPKSDPALHGGVWGPWE